MTYKHKAQPFFIESYYHGRRVCIGVIENDIFHVKRTAPNQYFVKYKGYGLEERAIQEFSKIGIKRIVVETKTTYYATMLDDWLDLEKAVRYNPVKESSQKYERAWQRVLPVKFMKEVIKS